MGYTVSMKDQAVAFSLTLSSTADSLKMKWQVEDYGSGSYLMSNKSLQTGTGMHLESPEPGAAVELPEMETLAFISQKEYRDLLKNKVMQFGDLKYALKQDDSQAIKVEDKVLDVLHLVAINGKTELWILNNPDFPLICKTKNGSNGVDLLIDYIK